MRRNIFRYYGNCDAYKGREKRNCEDSYASIDAKIAFDKSRPAVSGVWALAAKLSGVSGKKNYKNQKYKPLLPQVKSRERNA